MKNEQAIKTGARCLVLLSLLWVGMILVLDFVFNYSSHLHAMPSHTLPRFLLEGSGLRVMMMAYAFIPLLLIPGSVGAYYAFRDSAEAAMRTSMQFALVAVLAAMLSLMVWSGLNWHLGTFLAQVDTAHHIAIESVMFSLNYYFRILIGDYLGHTCMSIWILLTGYAILKDQEMPRWYGYLAILFGVFILGAVMLRMFSLTIIPDMLIELMPVAAVWMLFLGVGMLVHKVE